jgi:hypothetical protein
MTSTIYDTVARIDGAALLVTAYFFIVRHFYRRLLGRRAHAEGAR